MEPRVCWSITKKVEKKAVTSVRGCWYTLRVCWFVCVCVCACLCHLQPLTTVITHTEYQTDFRVQLSGCPPVLHNGAMQVTVTHVGPHELPTLQRTAPHLAPRCYCQTTIILFSLFFSFFKPFCISLFFSGPVSPPSLPPLVFLYGNTFLVFYSAPVKPGAYFQCPKLIANVRTDPSSRSLPPSPFGINSEDTWNIFVTILNPGVFMFLKVFPLYFQRHVFLLNFSGEKVDSESKTES